MAVDVLQQSCGSIPVIFPDLTGCYPEFTGKSATEMGDVFESGIHRYFGDIQIGVLQQMISFSQTDG